MNRVLLGILAGILLGAAATWYFLKPPAGAEATALERPAAGEASRVHQGTNGEVTVTLDAETQKRIALNVTALVATNLPPEVKGYGRVLDPAPLVQLVADLAPAQVAAEASLKEFERLQTLRSQDNASERALQAAEAVALRDKLLVDSLRAKLALGWGEAVAGSDQLPALAKSLAAMQSALVRIDLSAGTELPGKPTVARLVSLAANATPIDAEFVGAATSTDPQFQGRGFLFLVRGQAPAANTAFTGLIQTDGAPLSGLLIPADAIIRHQDQGWVYVQTGDDKFTRREVSPERAVDGGYFVTSGFKAGDKVVTTAAQLLLSEELKGQGGEE